MPNGHINCSQLSHLWRPRNVFDFDWLISHTVAGERKPSSQWPINHKMLSRQASTIAPSRPKGRARLTLAASSCPKSFDIGAARALHAKFPQTFRFWHYNCNCTVEKGKGLLQFVTVPTGLPASPSAALVVERNPPIRSWHSALLESESCTKKTKHEEGTQKTIELNSAQLRHGPMQLGIGNTSWQQRCRCRRRC